MAALSPSPLRASLWLALVLTWVWAGSVFTPWAEDLDHRLWLYDTRYYLGFALLFWGIAEAGIALYRVRRGTHRSAAAVLAMLALAGSVAVSATALEHTATGLAWRTQWSAVALRTELGKGDSDLRHRSGWLLVDTRRHPCGTSPWLWLGRPFGGGTGTSLALVHSPHGAPATPDPDAFRFRPVNGGWWLAYQHGAAYRRGLDIRRGRSCEPGTTVAKHTDGLRFVADGRAASLP
ncbi:hypothetical protein [Lysobacter niastensis]|uniref:Uncharacterized protein n=1 Tax=Lysobacter niastensis TaxID=380629 RepID=A0ABS0B6X2_9GAMM|nr:hypothetical protein [Lysobacter niastensis]MBF6024653.1 hypothetical protein [Lysobacter niastensis]